MNNKEKNKLKKFLVNVEEDINSILKNIASILLDNKSKKESKIQSLIVSAWEEVKPKFENAKKYMEIEDLRFVNRGLTGNQLTLKINVYEFSRKLIEKIFNNEIDYIKKNSQILIKHLEYIKSILGSLSFIPGIEAIQEFTDAIIRIISFIIHEKYDELLSFEY